MIAPADLPADLPEGVTRRSIQVLHSVRAGLEESFGQTHLVQLGAELAVLTRNTTVGPLTLVPLDPERPPRLAAGAWGSVVLEVTTAAGAVHSLDLSATDRMRVGPLLDRIYRGGQHWKALAELLERQLESERDTGRRIAALDELSALYATQLAQPERSAEHLLTLLAARPEHQVGLARLARLHAQGHAPPEAWQVLRRAYERARRYDALVALREAWLPHEPDPTARLAVLNELVELCQRKLGEPERAIRHLSAAVAIAPADERLRERLVRLAREGAVWAEAAKGCQAAWKASVEPGDVVVWARLAARIHQNQLGTGLAALPFWEAVLGSCPDDREALGACETLYLELGEWTRLAALLEARIERSELPDGRTTERVSLLLRLADLRAGALADEAGAVAALELVLAERPAEPHALEALTPLYLSASRWADAARVLERRAATAVDAARQAEFHGQRARLLDERLDNPAAAIDAWRAAFEAAPQDGGAAQALVRLLLPLDQHRDVVDVQLRHAETLPGAEARAWLAPAAALLEAPLAEPAEAVAVWGRVLEVAAGDLEALGALARLHRAGADWNALAATLASLGAHPELDADARAAAWAECGEVRAAHLGDAAGALLAWRALLELTPGDRALLERVADEAMALGAYDVARQALDTLEELAEGPSAVAPLAVRKAVLAEALGASAEEVRAHLERALGGQGVAAVWRDEQLTRHLVRLAASGLSWRTFVTGARRALQEVPEDERPVQLKRFDELVSWALALPDVRGALVEVLVASAEYYDASRDDPERALELYKQALRRGGEHLVDERIRDLLRRVARPSELAAYLRHAVDAGRYRGRALRAVRRELKALTAEPSAGSPWPWVLLALALVAGGLVWLLVF